jgi:hypothetical protein
VDNLHYEVSEKDLAVSFGSLDVYRLSKPDPYHRASSESMVHLQGTRE